MSDAKHPDIQAAVEAAGSQVELARRCGCAQQTISKALCRETNVTANLAVAIERATEGKIPRWKLRPDLWAAPRKDAA